MKPKGIQRICWAKNLSKQETGRTFGQRRWALAPGSREEGVMLTQFEACTFQPKPVSESPRLQEACNPVEETKATHVNKLKVQLKNETYTASQEGKEKIRAGICEEVT